MITLIYILLAILILSASALCIYLIIMLKKILQEVEAVRKDVDNLVDKAIPILNNLSEVSQRTNKVVSEIEHYWNEIDNSIKKVREKVANFTSLKTFQNDENPAKDLIKNLRAFVKGISTFWQTFKRR